MTAAKKRSGGHHKPPRPGQPAPWSSGLIDPLDYMVLSELPPEGSVLGYHPLGVTARVLASKLQDGGVTAPQVAGRVGTLHKLGYVIGVKIVPVDRGLGWQITPEGQRVLSAWKKSKTPITKGTSV